jgi:hypothetical protein
VSLSGKHPAPRRSRAAWGFSWRAESVNVRSRGFGRLERLHERHEIGFFGRCEVEAERHFVVGYDFG